MSASDDSSSRCLHVSAVVGGSGPLTDVEAAIRELAGAVRRADEASAGARQDHDATVDVTLHLPGPMFRPDYEGMRTGRFSRASRTLMIQVAVPDSLAGRPDAIREFLATSLVDGVGLAAEHFARRQPDTSADRPRAVAAAAAAAFVRETPT